MLGNRISGIPYDKKKFCRFDYLTVFFWAKKVFLESKGNFDCSVSPLVKAWGFYKDDLGDSLEVDSSIFNRILNDIGFQRIKLIGDSLVMPDNMSLDFNSLAQGFTVDLIGRYLETKNIHNFLVEVGGEILAKGVNDKLALGSVRLSFSLTNKIEEIEYITESLVDIYKELVN